MQPNTIGTAALAVFLAAWSLDVYSQRLAPTSALGAIVSRLYLRYGRQTSTSSNKTEPVNVILLPPNQQNSAGASVPVIVTNGTSVSPRAIQYAAVGILGLAFLSALALAFVFYIQGREASLPATVIYVLGAGVSYALSALGMHQGAAVAINSGLTGANAASNTASQAAAATAATAPGTTTTTTTSANG